MHWWQSAFSPPPSSPPSSTGMNLLDTYTGLDDQPKSSLFSFGGRAFGFRSHQRRLTRSKRLQDINQDVPSPHQLSRSPSGCTVAPQPLPLPELAVLLRQDAAHALPPSNSTASVRLPSPRTNKDQAPAHPSKCRGGEEREKSSEALRRDAHGNGDAVTSTAGFAR